MPNTRQVDTKHKQWNSNGLPGDREKHAFPSEGNVVVVVVAASYEAEARYQHPVEEQRGRGRREGGARRRRRRRGAAPLQRDQKRQLYPGRLVQRCCFMLAIAVNNRSRDEDVSIFAARNIDSSMGLVIAGRFTETD